MPSPTAPQSTTLAAVAALATGAALTSAFVQPGAGRGPALRSPGQAELGAPGAADQASFLRPTLIGVASAGALAAAASAVGTKRRPARSRGSEDGFVASALYTDCSLRAFENELGVQAPVGYWDPLKLAGDGDELKFKRRRQVELKHGRVSMLACIGYMAPEYFRLPGFLSPSMDLRFADMPSGLEAMAKVPIAGGLQIFFLCGAVERGLWEQDPDRAPGDFERAGNLGVPFAEGVQDPEARKRSLNAEIANGRLAMVAIMGMMFQNGTFGTTGPEMWLGNAAFENELGVQAPTGYWDPLGLAKDGDADLFYRRRATEFKHGRLSMIACLGYLTPEFFRWPGYLSPSSDLTFQEIPSGLGALAKIPVAGIAQWFLFCGFCEVYAARQNPNDPPGKLTGNDGEGFGMTTFGNLGIYRGGPAPTEEKKKRGLNSELANGRLAMFAIMGMMFQNGVTGTTGPEMWGPGGAFEQELGVQAPVGFWDPLGLSKDGDQEVFNRRRVTEIKHGRISMLATMGYITPEFARFPGSLSPSQGLTFESIPNGLAAISKVPALGWAQIIAYCLYCEASALNFGYFDQGYKNVKPGDYGWKPPLLATDDQAKRKTRLNAEIANGRLAMVAIIGMFFQDGLTGSAWGDWANYSDSPLRAFDPSGELGVQAPLGFWDPLGLSRGQDEATFRRRRAVELKHGRISMYATIGYIVPYYYKFDGYLSPSLGLKFSDVPNGLGAFSKLPVTGGAQIVAFCGYIEATGFFKDQSVPIGLMRDPTEGQEPGNFGIGFPNFFGKVTNPEERKKKLAAELANGRLAMVAIIGMFFQDGLTGSAWGDWEMYVDSPLRATERE